MSSSNSSNASASPMNDDSSIIGSDYAGEIVGPVARDTSHVGSNNSTDPQAPIYVVILFPPRTDLTHPVARQETGHDSQQEGGPEPATEIEEIVLSSDSEDDSDSDDSVIYIGTYLNDQRQSDQQDTTEEISEAMHTGDLDELHDYFRSI